MTKSDAELRIVASHLEKLRHHLLQDRNERIAIAHCTDSGSDLLVNEIVHVRDEDLVVSGPASCRLTNDAERRLIGDCTGRAKHPLVIHSHPFADTAWFSSRDDRMMESYQDWLGPLFPAIELVFGVLGAKELRCQRWDHDTEKFVGLPVRVLGSWERKTESLHRDNDAAVNVDRYDRSIRVLGTEGQTALSDSHVAVVGCGGTGSHMARTLARLGVGALTLVDPDRIEQSNLPRLAGATEGDVGTAKVSVVQQQCLRANPQIETTMVCDTVQNATEQLQRTDVIVAGLDKVSPRFWLNEFAVQHLIPYVDVGTRIDIGKDDETIERMFVALQTIVPGVTECIDCDEYFDPEIARIEELSGTELASGIERGYVDPDVLEPEPSVVDLNWLAAAQAVGVVKRLVTGGPTPPPSYLEYDDLGFETTQWQTEANDQCPTCGENGFLAAGEQAVDELADLQLTADSERSSSDVRGTRETASSASLPWWIAVPDTFRRYFSHETEAG
jgi:hypothetical protein